ncbi:hypothetical protein C7S16_3583 [Burkholderia thailandensis]|uniref:Uncharacterized protein n=1 Tax=Burkholderia thailandensis TaxID=57975 RepID=A0AAW9D4Y2_BURTH|nr:hypothetical protein [Burkholderia thailandensis]MDW9257048.1 hypothetical protein [Burkholderia thailandensis]
MRNKKEGGENAANRRESPVQPGVGKIQRNRARALAEPRPSRLARLESRAERV